MQLLRSPEVIKPVLSPFPTVPKMCTERPYPPPFVKEPQETAGFPNGMVACPWPEKNQGTRESAKVDREVFLKKA